MGQITLTNLTSGQTTGTSNTSTASITPGANKLILATVFSVVGAGGANTPTLSGNGITWVQVAQTTISSQKITLFRGMVSSPSAGVVTIDFGGQNQNSVSWIIDQVSGMDLTGSNGSGAIVQSNSGGSTSPLAVTLSAFSGNANIAYGTTGYNSNLGVTHGGNFTELAQNSSNVSIESEYSTSPQTTVNWTFGSGSTTANGLAVEIKAASQGGLFFAGL